MDQKCCLSLIPTLLKNVSMLLKFKTIHKSNRGKRHDRWLNRSWIFL